jgi:hypothetical protein
MALGMVHVLPEPVTPPTKRARWADIVDSDVEDSDDHNNFESTSEVWRRRGVESNESEQSSDATNQQSPRAVAPLFAATPSPEHHMTTLGSDAHSHLAPAPMFYGVIPVVLFAPSAPCTVPDAMGNASESWPAPTHQTDTDSRIRSRVCNTRLKRRHGHGLARPTSSQKDNGGSVNVCDDEWKARLLKRRAAINIVKSSPEYEFVAARRQNGGASVRMPRTPSPNCRHMSKRDWESVTMRWRVALRQCYNREVA